MTIFHASNAALPKTRKAAAPVLLAVLALVAVSAPTPAAAKLIAVTWDGEVIEINENTGRRIRTLATNDAMLNALAVDSTRVLTAADCEPSDGDCTLQVVDPASGGLTSGPGVAANIRALAFSASDVLYGIANGPTDELVVIDATTGGVTSVGSTSFARVQGLAFAPGGTLYAWDTSQGLLTVDVGTGLATDVNGSIGGTGEIQTLGFDASGTLYGGGVNENFNTGGLFTIDPATGAFALVGDGFTTSGLQPDVRGIEATTLPRTIFCGSVTAVSSNLAALSGAAVEVGDFLRASVAIDEVEGDDSARDSGPNPSLWTGSLGSLEITELSAVGSVDQVAENAASGNYALVATLASFEVAPGVSASGSGNLAVSGAGNSEATATPDYASQAVTGALSVSLVTVPDIGPVTVTVDFDAAVREVDLPGACSVPVPALPVIGPWLLAAAIVGAAGAMEARRRSSRA